jgi:hypothetical protein
MEGGVAPLRGTPLGRVAAAKPPLGVEHITVGGLALAFQDYSDSLLGNRRAKSFEEPPSGRVALATRCSERNIRHWAMWLGLTPDYSHR